MCSAIAACHAIDEVMNIHDKARALEVYAMQAKNTEAEQKACEIRLRAERKAGQMLQAMDKARGGGDQKSDHRSHCVTGDLTLAAQGISKNQSSRWQKLAAIPEADFEATFAQPGKKPSTNGIIATHQAKTAAEPKPPPVDPMALWLWGRLLDFERDGLLASDPNVLFETMLDHMKETTRELMPLVIDWCKRMSL